MDNVKLKDMPVNLPQCPLHGCAGQLLLDLRAHGCRIWGQAGSPCRFSLPMTLLITADTTDAAAAALAAQPMLTRHWQRMLMLLWAERGGRN